jgi:hypothetical protein
MHHTLSYVRVSSLFQGQLSAVKCDCSTGVFWIAEGQNRDEVIEPHLAPDDTYTFVEEDRTMIKVTSTPAQVDMKFELFPQDKSSGFYMKVTHKPTGMKWVFTPFPDETPLMLRERAFQEITRVMAALRAENKLTSPDLTFEMVPDPQGEYLRVTHRPTGKFWAFIAHRGESELSLRERALAKVTEELAANLLNDQEPDPSVEPERVTWPPVEPADLRFSRSTRKLDKTTQIGELQVTQVYTNKGSLLMRAFHTRTGTSMSIWANADETPTMAKVRVVRMMAAALRASSPGAIT